MLPSLELGCGSQAAITLLLSKQSWYAGRWETFELLICYSLVLFYMCHWKLRRNRLCSPIQTRPCMVRQRQMK